VQLRKPSYLILKTVSLFPYAGVQPMFFVLCFVLIDHRDEYQLVYFILLFKGSQFITVGLLSTVIGAILYYVADGQPVDFTPTSPLGVSENFLFVSQIAVVWAAFLLLPCSREKGRATPETLARSAEELEEIQGASECCGTKMYKGRGGRLRRFLVLDLVVFCVCAALVLARYFITGTDTPRGALRFAETLYWAKALYGLVSLPFMFFLIPVVGNLFVHALPTAYTKQGRCVPILEPGPMRKRAEMRRVAREARRSERALKSVFYSEKRVEEKLGRASQRKQRRGTKSRASDVLASWGAGGSDRWSTAGSGSKEKPAASPAGAAAAGADGARTHAGVKMAAPHSGECSMASGNHVSVTINR